MNLHVHPLAHVYTSWLFKQCIHSLRPSVSKHVCRVFDHPLTAPIIMVSSRDLPSRLTWLPLEQLLSGAYTYAHRGERGGVCMHIYMHYAGRELKRDSYCIMHTRVIAQLPLVKSPTRLFTRGYLNPQLSSQWASSTVLPMHIYRNEHVRPGLK